MQIMRLAALHLQRSLGENEVNKGDELKAFEL